MEAIFDLSKTCYSISATQQATMPKHQNKTSDTDPNQSLATSRSCSKTGMREHLKPLQLPRDPALRAELEAKGRHPNIMTVVTAGSS
jgi:hypothetical protein